MDLELTKKILNLNIAMGGLLFIVLFGYNRLEIGLMQAIALLIVFINGSARWAMRGQNKDVNTNVRRDRNRHPSSDA